ncbi:MAG: hypothetical protein DCC65_13585 [Planctomycetota bacterium]|nr:MAG: hypothetical protein DCC65_13585 [Planctomycetota bacterium]
MLRPLNIIRRFAGRQSLARLTAFVCTLLLVQGSPVAWRVSMPSVRVTEEENRGGGNVQEELRHASGARVEDITTIGRYRADRRGPALSTRIITGQRDCGVRQRGFSLRSGLPPGADPQRARVNGFGGMLTV